MKQPRFEESWPESWKQSYGYDLMEVFHVVADWGYGNAYRERFRRTLDAVGKVTPPNARLLDIAAAQGNFSIALAERGYRVTWNDLREELVDYVRLKDSTGAVAYAPGNCFDLQFPHQFDTVLITEVIEHVAHPDQFLASVARLVRPGGHVVMTTPHGGYFRNRLPRFSACADPSVYESVQFKPNADGHIFLLDAGEVEVLATQAGLALRDLYLFVNPLTRGCLGTSLLLRLLPSAIVGLLEGVTSSRHGRLCRHINLQLLAVFQKPI